MTDDQSTISRRKLLPVSAASGTAAVAGCSSAPDAPLNADALCGLNR